jgi:hypothetical protein
VFDEEEDSPAEQPPPQPSADAAAPPAPSAPVPTEPAPPVPVAAPTHGYNLRANPRASTLYQSAFHTSIGSAIRDNERDALAAIETELQGILDRDVFEPLPLDRANELDPRRIVPSLTHMKRKVDTNGVYKSWKCRVVASGNRQYRAEYTAQDTSSPTVSSVAVNALLTIAARDNLRVGVIDVTAAYLNAPIGREDIYMRLNREMSAVLVRLHPEYREFVNASTGCVIVRLKKALYGLIESAKLWYNHLSATLTAAGWTAMTTDRCVFQRIDSRGNKHHLCFHVDDILVISPDPDVIGSVATVLRDKYKKVNMTVGPSLEYLGMKLDFDSANGTVRITQPGYIKDILDSYRVTGHAKTPALPDLYEVDPASEPVDYATFISKVMKLMFLALRSRPDILLPVTFLASRSSAPTAQDEFKLNRVLMYLNGTQTFGLTLSPPQDEQLVMHAFVDASYACHPDARSHTGAIITLGRNGGPIYVHSAKQRIVTKSSFEAELVAINDALDMVMWTRRLLLELGIINGPTVLHQDNQSTIHVCKEGTGTRGRTRHIDVRYFYIRERLEAGDIELQYLATEDHPADLLTKPLAGALFTKLRQLLMNL